jgi:hypothetical protein
MKKYILLSLLLSAINCFSQELKRSDFYTRHFIYENVEIDGHISKEVFILEANLQGVKIYDKDKKEYIFRKCKKDKCLIIHLESKINDGTINFNRIYLPYTTK